MAKDAIEGHLEVLGDEGRSLPQPALIERVTVAVHAKDIRRGTLSGILFRRGISRD